MSVIIDKNIEAMREYFPDLPEMILAVLGAPYSVVLGTAAQAFSGDDPEPAVIAEEEEKEIDTELEYMRPNGEIYYARLWSGKKDVEVIRKARTAQLSPLLYGPPGTGKTALCDASFPDLITIVITGDTSVEDLVGQYIPDPTGNESTGYIWVDGPLVRAMLLGVPLLLDEVGLGDAKVLSILYGVMDGRNQLVVPGNPNRGIITGADGFFIIGATNPNAPGVVMSEALLSRFDLHVEVTTAWDLAGKMGVPEKLITVAQSCNTQVESGTLLWAPQFRELLAYKAVSELFDHDFALANLLASCPQDDREGVREIFKRTYGINTVLAARI